MTATSDLLAFAAAPLAPPPPVREAALLLLADTLAVGAAGATVPGADGVLAAAQRWGAGDTAPVLGRADRLPGAGAAFVNGFQIHALEWDAVHEPTVVHALSVVTAALMSACHAIATSRDDALAALIVGVEIASALGTAATGPLAFFRPATAGLIGAALACARIAGIPPERFGDVLGLAHAQCAGTMQAHVEGVALPLQIASAARAAVTAADLVGAGLAGPRDALTGPFGYFPLFDAGDPAAAMASLGHHWRTPEISIKPWPCGRAAHAALAVVAAHPGATAITAIVPPLIARLVGRPWLEGMTPAYARLCLPFLAALMARDGRIDPRCFTQTMFDDPELRKRGQRLTIIIDDNPDPNALAPQAFRVTVADEVREFAVAATLGSPANPLSPDALAAKHGFAWSLAHKALRLAPDPLTTLSGTSL